MDASLPYLNGYPGQGQTQPQFHQFQPQQQQQPPQHPQQQLRDMIRPPLESPSEPQFQDEIDLTQSDESEEEAKAAGVEQAQKRQKVGDLLNGLGHPSAPQFGFSAFQQNGSTAASPGGSFLSSSSEAGPSSSTSNMFLGNGNSAVTNTFQMHPLTTAGMSRSSSTGSLPGHPASLFTRSPLARPQQQILPRPPPPTSAQFVQHRSSYPMSSSSSTGAQSSLIQPSVSTGSKSNPPVIDLTSDNPIPTPPPPKINQPPQQNQNILLGLIQTSALVLYPTDYLKRTVQDPTQDQITTKGETIVYEGHEWGRVRLKHKPMANPLPGQLSHGETINVMPFVSGQSNSSAVESFAVVGKVVADSIAPLLARGLVRVEGWVRRQETSSFTFALSLLLITIPPNINFISNSLAAANLYLEDPRLPYDPAWFQHARYINPHEPGNPNGIAARKNSLLGRSLTLGGGMVRERAVEVQRSQVDEVFKSLKGGDDLEETNPGPFIGAVLYPHQKKALTFLREREGEKRASDGTMLEKKLKPASLWKVTHTNEKDKPDHWEHTITGRESGKKPKECRGAILADDMGLGKSLSIVSLIASTLKSAKVFEDEGLSPTAKPASAENAETSGLSANHFAGAIFGMPVTELGSSTMTKKDQNIEKKKEERDLEQFARHQRLQRRSRATLIVCPLTTVSNWEDQLREHWAGRVEVVGGGPTTSTSGSNIKREEGVSSKEKVLRVYVYHGNARRSDPSVIADFDVVITTFSTLATEFSKQNRTGGEDEASTNGTNTPNGADTGGGGSRSDDEVAEVDANGVAVKVEQEALNLELATASKKKRKRGKGNATEVKLRNDTEVTSPLQMIEWFRVVLDEAHFIKDASTVAARACCYLEAQRRICLTGTPIQNKLDDLWALLKFIRLEPFDDKSNWTEFISGPAKVGDSLGVARLQVIMRHITLRRTKQEKNSNGQQILDLPPIKNEISYLKFNPEEQAIYDQYFKESKDDFNELQEKGTIMKNYVNVLQRILRLRQICDHPDLIKDRQDDDGDDGDDEGLDYALAVASINKNGLNQRRALAVFGFLKETDSAQCCECAYDLSPLTASLEEIEDGDVKGGETSAAGARRKKKSKCPQVILTCCQHLFCIVCFKKSVFSGWPKVPQQIGRSCSACGQGLRVSRDAIEVLAPGSAEAEKADAGRPRGKPRQRPHRDLDQPLVLSTKIQTLVFDLMHFSKQNPYSPNYDPMSEEVYETDSSGQPPRPTKSIVFSQWTTMLDRIEDALIEFGIKYGRLDGTMKRDERTLAMDTLKTDPACEVLLVSLKAGGVGLNLTSANRCYMMDPYWNPSVENQAVDRIHRLGQTRPVVAIKYIMEQSMEVKMLQIQQRKAELAKLSLSQNLSKAELHERRMEDLKTLFSEDSLLRS